MTSQELQAKIRSASDKMRADDNTKNALKYLEQLTWLLFLKQWEAIESEREDIAAIDGNSYQRVIDGEYRWSAWTKAGHTGDDLINWVLGDLLPHLRALRGSPQAEHIAQLFESVTTVMKSGYSLAEVITIVDTIDISAAENHHALSVVYETLLAQTADAGWSGEFYTPRPIVEFMVELVDPKLGETVYDPCSGSCGFLVGTADHLRRQVKTSKDEETLTRRTVYGLEAGELAFLVGTMNLMLHGIDDPNTARRNTLEQDIRNIPPSAQHDIILTNPPYGGTEHAQVQQNFPARSSATELLFLQHAMATLKQEGRCGVVLPDGILFRAESAFSSVRRRLLKEFNVKGIVRLPAGVFSNAPGARTNLIFFDRDGTSTKSIRYFQVRPPANKPAFGKADPLTVADLAPALAWIRNGETSPHAWEVSSEEIENAGYDLNITPRLVGTGQGAVDPADHVQFLLGQATAIEEAGTRLQEACAYLTNFDVDRYERLDSFIEERGERAKDKAIDRPVGVSKNGGLVPFKGKLGTTTTRYRRLEVGDFVYNPMRVNVGSLALCRHPSEEGWVSPEYVVFRLTSNAPITAEYLLFYLKSQAGAQEIERHVQGSVRARLYYENLESVEVPVPAEIESWDKLLTALQEVHRAATSGTGAVSLDALATALF